MAEIKDSATADLDKANAAARKKEAEKRDKHLKDIENTLGKAKASFDRFDVTAQHNEKQLSEISGKSSVLKTVVEGMDKVKEAANGSWHEQKIAKNHLKILQKEIATNGKLSKEEKELLEQQADTLQQGFRSNSTAMTKVKGALEKYSDAAVAGITTLLGNSPATMFLSKLVVDQTKNFFARKKEKKIQKARLAKQRALDSKKIKKSEEIVDAIKEADDNSANRESPADDTLEKILSVGSSILKEMTKGKDRLSGLKSKEDKREKPKAKVVKEEKKKNSGNILKIIGSLLLKPLMMLAPVVGGVGAALGLLLSPITLVKNIFSGLWKVLSFGVSKLKNLLGFKPKMTGVPKIKKPSLAKRVSAKVSNAKGSLKGSIKNIATKSRGLGSKVLSHAGTFARGALRFAGPAAAVAGAGMAGYEAGKYIRKIPVVHKLANKGTNAVYNFWHGDPKKLAKKRNAEDVVYKNGLAKAKGYKSWDDMAQKRKAGEYSSLDQNAANNGVGAKAKHIRNDTPDSSNVKKTSDSQDIFIQSTAKNINLHIDGKSNIGNAIANTRRNNGKKSRDKNSFITSTNKEIREKQTTNNHAPTKVISAPTSNVVNHNSTTVQPSPIPWNADGSYIAASKANTF